MAAPALELDRAGVVSDVAEQLAKAREEKKNDIKALTARFDKLTTERDEIAAELTKARELQTREIATPLRPARPVRPLRWT